jgi:hypothetical protein
MDITTLTFNGLRWLYKNYLEKIEKLISISPDAVEMDLKIAEFAEQVKRLPQDQHAIIESWVSILKEANDNKAKELNKTQVA